MRSNPRQFALPFPVEWPDVAPRCNIAPTQRVPILRQVAGNHEAILARWGLIPSWAKDEKIGYQTINARSETIHQKPAFRGAFKRRRCLLPADGYYEWRKLDGKSKQPFHIRMNDERPFFFFGLWETWDGPKDAPLAEPLRSCTIITTNSNELTAAIHDRMPAIAELESDGLAAWLDAEFADTDYLRSLLEPFPSEEMAAIPVSRYVNSPRNEGEGCLEPVTI